MAKLSYGFRSGSTPEEEWNKIFGFLEDEEIPTDRTDEKTEFQRQMEANKAVWNRFNQSFSNNESLDAILSKCTEHYFIFHDHSKFAFFLMERFLSNDSFNAVLSFEGGIPWKISESVLRTAKKTKYTRSWSNPYDYAFSTKFGSKRVNRGVIIQYGIVLGLGEEKVNEWLRIRGQRMLYPLDIVDIISEFYLNKYCDKGCESVDEANKRLGEVKGKINKYLEKISEEESTGNVSTGSGEDYDRHTMIRIKNGENYVDIRHSMDLYDGEKKRWVFDSLRQTQLKKTNYLIREEEESEKKNTVDDILTRRIHRSIKDILTQGKGGKAAEEDFFKALDENLDVFQQLPYAFYAKKKEYLTNLEKIKKGLVYYGLDILRYTGDEFLSEGHMQAIKNEQDKWEETEENTEGEYKEYDGYLKKLFRKKKSRNTYCVLAGHVFTNSNLLEKNICYEKGDNSGKTNSTVINYVEGKKENGKPYVSLMDNSLCQAVEYCIGTGNEDDIANYLKLGMFWDKDYHKDEVLQENTKFTLMEVFLNYAFRCRDRILEKWYKESGEKDKILFMKKGRQMFPFHALTAMISRDIEFADERICIMSRSISESMIPFLIRKSDYAWKRKDLHVGRQSRRKKR